LTLALALTVDVQAQSSADAAQPLAPPTAASEQSAPIAFAPSPDEMSEDIDRKRKALALQRQTILQTEEAQLALCWQKFAVNACQTAARRERRQAIEPLRLQELALNAQERLLRTQQRELRLQSKQPAPERAP
jgi:hypothetical protein